MKRSLIALFFLSFLTTQALDKIPIPKLAAPSLIDGMLTESCWSKALKTGDFKKLDGGKPKERTEGMLFADKENLYIGMNCYFSNYDSKEKETAAAKKPFDADVAEIFIDPGNTGAYIHIALNVAGIIYFPEKQGEVQYGVQLHKDHWSLEMKIPFKSLKLKGGEFSNDWKINLARGNRKLKENSTWAPLVNSTFHDAANFYKITGIETDLKRQFKEQELSSKGNFEITFDKLLYDGRENMKVSLDLKYTKSMKGFKLNVHVASAAGKEIQKQTIAPVFFKNEFEIPLNQFADAEYRMIIELKDKNGKILESGTKTFWKIPPKTSLQKDRAEIRNHCIYRNGEFFFPIITTGWAGKGNTAEEYLTSLDNMARDIAEHGFNTINNFSWHFTDENFEDLRKFGSLPSWEWKTFKMCAAAGITFADHLKILQKYNLQASFCNGYTRQGISDQNISLFVRQMLRYRDHKGILWWKTADETDGQIEENKIRHQLYKEIDPSRVTWLNVINAVAQNRDAADVLSTDPYPIPNGKITMVSAHVDRLMENTQGKPGQTQILWIQNFGGEGNWTRPPTPQEVRCMTYLALNHGIKGLAYFIYIPPERRNKANRQNPASWEAMKDLNKEVTDFAPIFCLGKRLYSGMQKNIDITVIEYQEKLYISCVNTLNEPLKDMVITVPSLGNATGKDLLKKTKLKIEKGIFSDSFGAYGVNLYQITKQ